ncbi:unnamed protein product [Orchesella dallaii]|uniref:Chitin-binding type-4 domain-containing protein n=1 Tax=Orchesella dallaii TaxID=48710 RepID=A0ABP1QNM8_9HEXA
MSRALIIASSAILLLSYINSVYPHGRLMEPPSRSSLWHFEEFEEFNPPINYDDTQLYCGSKEVQWNFNDGKCGECGDSWNQTKPRDNENGGLYGNGIIVRNYTRGQNISVAVELTAPHLGHFEFKVCPLRSSADVEEQSCFDRYQVQILQESGTEFHHELPIDNTLGWVNVTATLPSDLTCEHCSFLWYYKTGNSWGDCGNGTEAIGCGPQEEFRGCADITILP